jgi:F-type H+-transporting ATPase subunit delta
MTELATVARPYAEAAFKLARANDNLASWSAMLALIEAVVCDQRIASRIGDPSVHAEALEGLVLDTLGTRLDRYGRNFVQLLIHNRRLDLMPQIRALYDELRRQHEGILEATIVSAMPVGDDQTSQIVVALEKKYGRTVKAQVEVDPALIGGARIVIGDTVIDATVRGSLDAMAAALTR